MKFLIKIEEAINQFIVNTFEKWKSVTPPFFLECFAFAKQLPVAIKKYFQTKFIPKIRIFGLKCIGYTEHYTTLVRGKLMSVMIYLRSDEFKKADKKEMLLAPLRFAKFHPLKALFNLTIFALMFGMLSVVYKNTEKIVAGTKALRKPASMETAEADMFVEIKNFKFEVEIGGGEGGGHGAAPAPHEQELFLDIQLEAPNENDKAYLEQMEEKIDDALEYIELPVKDLPLTPEGQKAIEEVLTRELNEEFKQMGHANVIKAIKVKQVLPGRPNYYRQAERIILIEDINLQLFLEDTNRNRQIYIDFSLLTSNRNVVLYLKDHNVELKDHLSTNVEPVIPQLPIEEEGRQIIKDKLKSEINFFLEKNGIEGKVQEVYIEYLIVS